MPRRLRGAYQLAKLVVDGATREVTTDAKERLLAPSDPKARAIAATPPAASMVPERRPANRPVRRSYSR